MAAASLFFVLFLLFNLLFIHSSANNCPKSFFCGNLPSLEFPLAQATKTGCGLFMVNCTNSTNPRIQLTGDGREYQILEKISVNKFKLRDPMIQEGLRISQSCLILRNLSLPSNPSTSFTFSPNLTFLTCDNRINENGTKWDVFKGYKNYTGCGGFTVFYSNSTDQFPPGSSDFIPGCTSVEMPVKSNQDSGDLFDMLTAEFVLEWNVSDDCRACHGQGGQCPANNLNQFECNQDTTSSAVVVAAAISGGSFIVMACLFACFTTIINHTRLHSVRFFKAHMKNKKEIELFLKNHENFAPRRYKYCELIRITNSLNESWEKEDMAAFSKGNYMMVVLWP